MAEKISEYVDSPAVPITYPNGQLVDESAPGANDGTLVRNSHIQDMWNVFSKAMDDTGTVFDTNPDTQTSSQFFDALAALIGPVVGTLEQSFLTEAQFLAQPGRIGGTWVRCNGQNVAGSKYETITGLSVVPNLTGRFLRDSTGSDTGLKTTQANQMGAHIHELDDSGHAKIHSDTAAGQLFTIIDEVALSPSDYYDGDYNGVSGTLTAIPNPGTQKATGLGGVTSAIASQTTETRPDSIIVNTFIKIN